MIWPQNLEKKLSTGFTDQELENLCAIDTPDPEKNFFSAKKLFWTSELYGFGKSFRTWLNWPFYLPLPFYSDHGISREGLLFKHEQESASRYHFVWNKGRFEFSRSLFKKRMIRVPHPWIAYRHRSGYMPKPNRKGTLVFYPHTTYSSDIEFDANKYIEDLKALPDFFKPLVICLHPTDVQKGLHLYLRQVCDFPIISAGNNLVGSFVDRFYTIISHFRYATSPYGGSELYYCQEFGVFFFIHGEVPKIINLSEPNTPLGEIEYQDIIHQKIDNLKFDLFKNISPGPSPEKSDFLISMMGLDSNISLKKLKISLYIELIRLLPYYIFKCIIPAILNRLYEIKKNKK